MTKPIIAALLCAALASVAKADLSYTFDSGSQGFTASSAILSWDPAGYLRIQDNDGSNDMLLHFPAVGDWSAYLGGTLSFDARNANVEHASLPDWADFGDLTLLRAGSPAVHADLVAAGQPPADGQFHRYTIALTSANFGADLPTVLAAVGSATLNLEFHQTSGSDFEAVDIDNVRLAAVPEPASLALWLSAGAAGFAWRLRRC